MERKIYYSILNVKDSMILYTSRNSDSLDALVKDSYNIFPEMTVDNCEEFLKVYGYMIIMTFDKI